MTDWIFDRERARTPGAPAQAQQPAPDVAGPATAEPHRRRLRPGRRGLWVAAAVGSALVTVGVAAAASEEPAPATAARGAAASPSTGRTGPDTTLPDPPAPDTAAPDTAAPGTTPPDPMPGTTPPDSTVPAPTAPQTVDGDVVRDAGHLTAVSDDAVTVLGTDGTERTYAVTADTRFDTPSGAPGDLSVGDAVLVEAVVEGDTATASLISPATGRGHRGGPPGGALPRTAPDETSSTTDT